MIDHRPAGLVSALTDDQLDRAAGVLLGQACGDALGVPYESGPSLPAELRLEMSGGGLGHYRPGEWSDDTQMALCVAQVAAGSDLTEAKALDDVAQRFLDWLRGGATDVGNLTRVVLREAERREGTAAERCREAARIYRWAYPDNAAGNGALMRTGAVGLAHLHDRRATAAAACAVAELTHADPLCGESCVLWSEAVRVAVVEGRLELRAGLDLLPEERRGRWRAALDEVASQPAAQFVDNGFTVTALQAAWAAIRETASSTGERHVRAALEAAVRIGHDTDTVAAIAGSLVGARWGASCVPQKWRAAVRGWPGLEADGLVRLGRDIASAGIAAND